MKSRIEYVEPIPVKDLINIQIESSNEAQICYLEIYDFTGVKLGTLWKGNIYVNGEKLIINMKDYENGSYILLLKGSDNQIFDTARIVIYK